MESFSWPYECALLQQRNDSVQFGSYLRVFTCKLKSSETNYEVSTSKKNEKIIKVKLFL
jgi:hypothetical protein